MADGNRNGKSKTFMNSPRRCSLFHSFEEEKGKVNIYFE